MEPYSPRSPTKISHTRSSIRSPRTKPPVSLAAVNGLPSPPQSPSTDEVARTPVSSALPPLVPNGGVASPRLARDAGIALRPRAFPLQLDRDYPVAQLDNWPLTSSTTLSWNGPVPSSPRQENASTSSSQQSSPLSPRVRKSQARHQLFDDSKSKPLLLQELHAFAKTELRAIDPSRSDDTDAEFMASTPLNLQRLQVFRELFDRVIESFNVYAPLLAQIKDEYDAVIQHLVSKCQLLPQLHGELQSLEAQCLEQLSKHQIETKLKHKALKHVLKQTQATLTACAAENAHLKDENARVSEQLRRLEQRYEEMHLSNHSLVNGMKRHDDTLRHIHERSREEGMALQQMTLKYHRACDEIAELKKTVATLEEKVGGVHVAADKATIALLTKDLMDMTARLVAIRIAPNDHDAGDSDGTTLSPDVVLHKILLGVLEASGAGSSEVQLLELVRAYSLGANAPSPSNSKIQSVLSRTSSTFAVAPTPSLALSSSRAALPSTASPTKPTPPRASTNPLTGISAADLAFGIDRVTSILTGQVALFHQQARQLAHRASQQQQHQDDPSSTFITEPEEVVGFVGAAPQVLTPLVSANDFITAKGTDASVPEYLQYEGIVRNHFYDRKRVELLISKVWTYKDDLDGKTKRQNAVAANPSAPLGQAFSSYLQRCFPTVRHDQVECAYNVVAALDRFAAASSECRLFKLVLEGQLPDEVRSDQMKELVSLHDALASTQRELKNHNQRMNGTGLPLADVVCALRRHFPWKSDAQLSRLHRALLSDMRGQPLVDFTALLQQQDDAAPSRQLHALSRPARARSQFVECLRAQYIDDLLGFRRHLQCQVKKQCIASEAQPTGDDGPHASDSMVAVRVLRECLQGCDPAKPVQDINRLLTIATGLSMDQILTHDAMMVSAVQFMAALPTLLVKPSGKFGGESSLAPDAAGKEE